MTEKKYPIAGDDWLKTSNLCWKHGTNIDAFVDLETIDASSTFTFAGAPKEAAERIKALAGPHGYATLRMLQIKKNPVSRLLGWLRAPL